MSTITRVSGWLLALACAALLSACGTTTLSQVRDGKTDSPVWPKVEDAHPLIAQTQYPQVSVLRQMHAGMSKLDIYQLIGHPHYREGMAGVREWNYVFFLPQPNSKEFVTCQYKILFDDNLLSQQTFWNPTSCAALIDPPVVKAVPPPPPVKTIEISADTLFEFDSAKLSADAPAAIDSQVIKVLDSAEHVDVLRVVGYTDRLGSDAHNQRLSEQRALSVKNYLISHGVPAQAIQTEGRGASQPRVQCQDSKNRSATIACLAPNRRVEITVTAR